MSDPIRCPHCGGELDAKLQAKYTPKYAVNGSAMPSVADVFASSTKPTPTTRKRHSYEDPWFQGFWEVYPRKIEKKPASQAFNRAIKRGANPQSIIDATIVFAALIKRTNTEQRFVPYPAKWLNNERYEDEVEAMLEDYETDPSRIKGTPEWDARVQAEEEEAIREMSYEL